MLAVAAPGLFRPAGLFQNTTAVVRAAAVQHSGSQAAAGNLKHLWKLCCGCACCPAVVYKSGSLAPLHGKRGRIVRINSHQSATVCSNPERAKAHCQMRTVKYECVLWPATLTGLELLQGTCHPVPCNCVNAGAGVRIGNALRNTCNNLEQTVELNL